MCKDSRLTFLNGVGYNVIRLPQEGINPLDAIGRDNKEKTNMPLGSISRIWKTDQPAPKPDGPLDATDINGQRTDDLKLSVGLDILHSALSGMGVKSPRLDGAYEKARSVQFEFTNVKILRIEPLAIGEYLAAGDLNTANPFASYFRGGKDQSAFVISEVLRSDTIRVSAKDKSGASLAVNVPNIQQVVGVDVKVQAGSGGETTVAYKSSRFLTFGFRVFGVAFMDGDWRVFGVKPGAENSFSVAAMDFAGAGALSGPDPDAAILLTGSGLLELEQPARSAAGV
jgi:hypothetical protein